MDPPSLLAVAREQLQGILPHRRAARAIAGLAASWGRPRTERRDPARVGRLTELDTEPDADDWYRVDARTWRDLDMPLVFGALDRAISPVGAHRLHQMLSTPRRSPRELDRRERLIALMHDDPRARLAVQRELVRLDAEPAWDLADLLWRDIPRPPVPLWLLRGLGWALPVAAVLGFWFPGLWLAAMGLFGTNVMLEIWLQRHIAVQLEALGFLRRLLATARKIGRDAPGLEAERAELDAHLVGTQAISRKGVLLSTGDPFDLSGYIRTALLLNAINFVQLRSLIAARRAQLCAIYKLVGLLDAAQAIASFRTEHPEYAVPRFVAGPGLSIAAVRHPAVAGAVGNDLELADGRALLVTGSNMAGKTTFLKTVGINAILAQTVNTALATRYQAPLVRVMSSINVLDDIGRGKSYYLDEVESLLRLVRAAGSGSPALFIVDEVLRGTNPIERVAAATELLGYLARHDIVLAATHDLELCELVAPRYDSAHFQERVSAAGLEFDYQLRPGPSTTRNAIALLRHVGYPDEIVDAASARAEASLARWSAPGPPAA